MDEDKVRTLPPLVYGKLSGILDFVFDKLELLGQANNKHAACSLAVHILWWGENKPLFLRPKIIEILTEDEKNQIFIDEHGRNSVRYEIKTKLNLFKSYLAKCDLMELAVVDTLTNEIIGSAFLKDLMNLVFSSHPFSNSLINHMGDVIGEITYHFTFYEMTSKESPIEVVQPNFESDLDKFFSNNGNSNKFILNLSQLDSHRDDVYTERKSTETYHLLGDNEFQRSTNLHYNSPTLQNFESKLSEPEAVKVQEYLQNKNLLECDSSVNPIIKHKDNHSSEMSVTIDNDKHNNFIRECAKNTDIKKVLTETTRIIPSVGKKKIKAVESSKVSKLNTLSKELKQRESSAKAKDMNSKNLKNPVKLSMKKMPYNKRQNSAEKKISESKTTGFNLSVRFEKKNKESNAIDAANYINMRNRAQSGKNSNFNLKSMMKPTEKLKTIENISNEISKINKICFNSSRLCKDKHSELEKLCVENNGQDLQKNKIFQYSNDATNIIDFDPNVVKMEARIENMKQIDNKLCKNEKSQFNEKTAPYYEGSSATFSSYQRISANKKLRFDLNDPIERLYYETFFSKTFQNNEFEIAEILNQTVDKYVLSDIPCSSGSYNKSTFNRSEHIAEDKLKNKLKTKKNVAHKKETRQSLQEVNDEFENCSDIFEEESDNLSKTNDEKLSSAIKNKLNEEKTTCNDRNEVLNFSNKQNKNLVKTEIFPYCFDCHRFVYSKKLKELDKIIGALKNFQTDLKNETKISTLSFESSNVKEIVNESSLAENFESRKENYSLNGKSPDQEIILKSVGNESDYSKEDSDFIEFTHYMSKR